MCPASPKSTRMACCSFDNGVSRYNTWNGLMVGHQVTHPARGEYNLLPSCLDDQLSRTKGLEVASECLASSICDIVWVWDVIYWRGLKCRVVVEFGGMVHSACDVFLACGANRKDARI